MMMQNTLINRAVILRTQNPTSHHDMLRRIAGFLKALLETRSDRPYGLSADKSARLYL